MSPRDDQRGQALTLEALTASILLLLAVAFALQMTAVTPLSASTSSQHLENQLQKTGQGLLASTDANGTLRETTLDWNQTEDGFDGAEPEPFFNDGPPENAFGADLDRTYGNRSIAYNVIIHYHTNNGGMDSQQLVNQGETSDHAVSASRTIALRPDDKLPDGTALEDVDEDDFYAPNLENEDSLYNLVRVEVIAWRI